MRDKKAMFIVRAAVIAAMYAALTILLAPISFSIYQVRVSEALTILPFFTTSAIPGLYIGCLISSFYGGNIYDIILGSLATLIAAYFTYKMPKKWLAPLPPVIFNAVIVGTYLAYMGKPTTIYPYLAAIGSVAVGELIACYALGYPLLLILKKYKRKIF